MKASVVLRGCVALALAALALYCAQSWFVRLAGDEVSFRWALGEIIGDKPLHFAAYFTTTDSPELSESKVVRTDYRGDTIYTVELPDSITSLRLDVKFSNLHGGTVGAKLPPAEITVNGCHVEPVASSPYWLGDGISLTTYVPQVSVGRRVVCDWDKLFFLAFTLCAAAFFLLNMQLLAWRCAAFIAFVAILPWCWLDKRDSSPEENRVLARFPNTFDPKSFEAAFNDRFSGRRFFINVQNAIRDFIGAGEDPGEKAHCGRDGWFFFKETLEDFSNTRPWMDGTMEKAGAYIAGIADYCRAHGKKFAFVIGPDKCRIYPEKVRHPIKVNDDSASNTERFVAFLREHYSFPVIYSREELLSRKSQTQEPLYYPMDTHWTHLGAYYGGYLPLMRAFGINPIGVEWESKEYLQADLRSMNRKAKGIIDHTAYSVPKLEVNPSLDKLQTFSGGRCGAGRLFALRDSFFIAVTPFVAATFEDCTLCWRLTLEMSDKTSFDAADYVVLELVERSVSAFANMGENPIPWEVK